MAPLWIERLGQRGALEHSHWGMEGMAMQEAAGVLFPVVIPRGVSFPAFQGSLEG